MPHDALDSYYGHDAKVGAYRFWPHQVARELSGFSGSRGQIHVTMSGAVVNNVNDLKTYPMERRDPGTVINGVPWNKVTMDTMQILAAREIGMAPETPTTTPGLRETARSTSTCQSGV